jgi:tetratricopeptide (TPR) repeat protein
MWRSFCLSLALISSVAPAALAGPSKAPAAPSGALAGEDNPSHEVDRLYDRLARTRFSDEAAGIIAEINRLRLRSGSDTADLLLGRAMKARASSDLPLALKLFDAVVDFYPDWPEAWSERATARFQSGDSAGAMADIAQTLKRDPRDIGALSGLAAMMLDSGDPEASLTVYDGALKLAPAYEPLKEARARAQTEVWRRSP